MKAVILAGGLGTRIAEESDSKPKPMVDVGGRPLLWHIMKMYAQHGVNEFVICLGYKGYVIKEFFFNYHRHMSDMRIDLQTGDVQMLGTSHTEDWKVTLVDTGAETMTGGRLKRAMLWRSGQHYGATESDLAQIAALGLTSVFDLRSSRERTSHPCRRPEGFAAEIFFSEDPAALKAMREAKAAGHQAPQAQRHQQRDQPRQRARRLQRIELQLALPVLVRLVPLAAQSEHRHACFPRQRTPVWPKPPWPRVLSSKVSTTCSCARTTGSNTSCATRSPGAIVNAASLRFHRLTISGPW